MESLWLLAQDSTPVAIGNWLIEVGEYILRLPGEMGWGAVAGVMADRVYIRFRGLKVKK